MTYYGSAPRRKVFVSYHHGGDQWYYEQFALVWSQLYDVVYDNSLERRIDSANSEYIMRQIRENFIEGSSCTIVLCGQQTPLRKFVDWEIDATLQKQHGLIGVKLPTLAVINNGCDKPPRLQDNIDSGYAPWIWWEDLQRDLGQLGYVIEQANAKPKSLATNSRSRRLYNG